MEERIVIMKQGSFGIFVRGIIVGAAIGLLLAPRAGVETRNMLTEKGAELKDKAVDIAADTRSRAENVIHDARNKIEGTIKNVKETRNNAEGDLKREVEIMEDINNPQYNV